MRRFSGWVYDHRRFVLPLWILILLGVFLISRAMGPAYKFDIDISGSESIQGINLYRDHTPPTDGERLTIVWSAPDATDGVMNPDVQKTVTKTLTTLRGYTHVKTIIDPYSIPMLSQIQVSPDKKVAYATLVLDQDLIKIPASSVNQILDTIKADDAASSTVILAASGQAIEQANPPAGNLSEGLGMLASGIILLLAFGSLIAASLPLATAAIALGSALSTVTIATHWLSIPSFAPQLVSLISIGVGIDYALFVVSRHRAGLMRGKPVREAAIEAFDTSGRAVMFAGITVMISLLGLFVTGLGFLEGLAIAASIGVMFTMLVTITLLPALLGFAGVHVLGRKAQKDLNINGPHDDERSTRWGTWAATIQRHPWKFIIASTLILGFFTLPILNLRLGSADQGSDPKGTITRTAYDLITQGFGPGTNGPLLIITSEGHASDLAKVAPVIAKTPGVASILPPQTTEDGQIGFMTVTPTTSPQAFETSDLIIHLRDDVLPPLTQNKVYVSGGTAIFDDFAVTLQDKLPWFLLGVLTLSSLLLMVAFRSIAIPLKAAAMNLLAAGASIGILTAVFQQGWGANLIGIDRAGPIDAYIPIMLLAVLFGLSMDYQVFLVSRIREEWVRTHDNSKAVTLGLSETGRVITAAALVMIFVFIAFIFGGERIIKMFGVGLAAAIFLDAFVIRSLLVPALMQVLGKWNWWIPKWLDRILPRITIEPAHLSMTDEELENETAQAPQP